MITLSSALYLSLVLSANKPEILADGDLSTGSDALTASLSLTQAVATGPQQSLYFVAQSQVFRLESNGSLAHIAGQSRAGYSGDGGPATAAQLRPPYGIAVSKDGNVYISDYGNHRIRRVNPDGVIETIAGNGTPGFSGEGNAAVDAQLRYPAGIKLDADGNLYIADMGNHIVRKVTTDGLISNVAGIANSGYSGDDASAVLAYIHSPTDIALDGSGNLFIADYGNNRIRKVDTTGKITTFAGRGNAGFEGDGKEALTALFSGPIALAIDSSNSLYVSDYYNHRIRKITSGGTISTYAASDKSGFTGDGAAATAATLYYPRGIVVDSSNNLYLADLYNQRIRKIISSGTISTIAGNGAFEFGGEGGNALNAQSNQPAASVYDAKGNLFIADTGNHRVRVVSADGSIRTVDGNGTPSSAQLSYPSALAADADGNVYIADSGNDRIRMISADGTSSSLTTPALRNPSGLATDAAGNLYISDTYNRVVLRRSKAGDVQTVMGAEAGLTAPYGLSVDAAGNLYVADFYSQKILKRAPDGSLSVAFGPVANSFPIGVTADATGRLFVSFYGMNEVVSVDPSGAWTMLLDGSELFVPQGLATNSAGELIISDSGNNRILRLSVTR